MRKEYFCVRWACFFSLGCMALVSILPPLLFLTFRTLYGISYSQLGALVLLNFCTQLLMDLVLSFYGDRVSTARMLRLMPVLSLAGLLIYASAPMLGSHVYAGLVLGTIIFSAANGFAEVLLTPVFAALPSPDPEREINLLHSSFAWSEVLSVAGCTLFFAAVGPQHWQLLVLLCLLIPIVTLILFCSTPIPSLRSQQKSSSLSSLLRQPNFLLCFFCILSAGATECSMSQWGSGFLERALGIPKAAGDVFGIALFALMLGLGRSLYTRYGCHLRRFLILGASGAFLCYLTAALTSRPLPGLLACGLTGFCCSILWPGSLVMMTERFPAGDVTSFALMAAGGDIGASLGPQMIGFVTDTALHQPALLALAGQLHLTPDQLGMKLGLLLAALFPLAGIFLFSLLKPVHRS